MTAGLVLPTRERAVQGDWDPQPLVEIALRAEALGFDSVWTGDSLTARPRLEPLTLLAGVAASTRRIGVGTAALTAALRPPLPTAAAIATLDRLAGGRLVLAVGAGFPSAETEAEFVAAGVPYAGRLARLGRTVEQWRAAWRSDEASGFPTPTADPPVWLAGAGPAALRLTADAFDGWLPYLPAAAAYREASRRLDDLAGSAGRDPGTIARGLYVTVAPELGGDEIDAWSRAYYGVGVELLSTVQAVVAGSIDDCHAGLAAYADAGAGHVVLRIASLDTQRHLEAAAELAERWRALPAR